MSAEVNVILEGDAAGLDAAAESLLCLGRDIAARNGGELVAHSPTPVDAELASAAGSLGVAKIVAANEDIDVNAFVAAFCAELGQAPGLILAPATTFGKDVAARVAARCELPLICNASAVEWRGEDLCVTRPVYNRKASQRTVLESGQAVVTVVEDSYRVTAVGSPSPAATVEFSTTPLITGAAGIEVLSRFPTPPEDLALDEVDVIVAGGMGLGGPEGFAALQELAALLGGRVGASRMVTDRGWISTDALVGQTGTTVAPKLYIACGISGAPQHLIGMRDAATIIVINTDPQAAISTVADLVLAADIKALLPAITARLKKPAAVAA